MIDAQAHDSRTRLRIIVHGKLLEMDEHERCPNIDHNKVLDRVGRNLLRTCIEAAAAPYYLLYDRNTKIPILNIARAASDEHAEPLLRSWFETKSREAQYVQVAGAVVFASAISTLSWTGLDGRHWSGPACWYTSIILALIAVLSGAQQTILLESMQGVDPQQARARLCNSSNEPRWTVVFAWQSHLMFLAWALVFYLAGLTSYIASPVAANPVWNDDAKTLLFYVVTAVGAGLIFALSSRLIHSTFSTAN